MDLPHRNSELPLDIRRESIRLREDTMDFQNELRKEPRIPAVELPSYLQKFRAIWIPRTGPMSLQEMLVELVDASLHGYGLWVYSPDFDFVPESTIVLYPLERRRAFYGTIRYAVGGDRSRLGILLHPSVALEAYQEEIRKFLP